MPLPKISSPLFKTHLPIIDKDIQYRPYTVKEEKILLLGQQGGELADMIQAIKQVVGNCIVEDIDVGTLPMFDLQMMIVLLRIASTGDDVTLSYHDFEDDQNYRFVINMNDLVKESVENLKIPKRDIQIDDDWGITMKHITIDMFMNKELDDLEDPVKMYDVLGNTIEKVYNLKNHDEVYFLSDSTQEEIVEFVDTFENAVSQKIGEYLRDLPNITKTIEYTNKKGTERKIEISGLTDFFR